MFKGWHASCLVPTVVSVTEVGVVDQSHFFLLGLRLFHAINPLCESYFRFGITFRHVIYRSSTFQRELLHRRVCI